MSHVAAKPQAGRSGSIFARHSQRPAHERRRAVASLARAVACVESLEGRQLLSAGVFDRVGVNGAGYIHGMVASPSVDVNGYRPIYSRYDGPNVLRRWVPDSSVPASEGGGYWRMLGENLPDALGRGRGIAVPQSPGRENVVFVTLGDTTNKWAMDEGAGVYKSTDYGETLTKVLGWSESTGPGFGQTYYDDTGESGEGLAIDPNNPEVVYYAARTRIWNWGPGTFPNSQIVSGGLWRSLTGGDAGTWSQTSAPMGPYSLSPDTHLESGSGVLFVRIDGRYGTTTVSGVTVSKRIYIAYRTEAAGASTFNGGVYMSNDGGQTFAEIPGSPDNPSQIDLAPSAGGNHGIYIAAANGVYRFNGNTNATAADWTNITPSGQSGQPFSGLASDPEDRNRLIAKGFISTNGGSSWSAQHARNTSSNTQINSANWIKGPSDTDPNSSIYGYAYPYSHPVFIPDTVADGKTPEMWDPQVFGTFRTPNIYASVETAGAKVQWNFHGRNNDGQISTEIVSVPEAPGTTAKLYFGGQDVNGFRVTDFSSPHVGWMESSDTNVADIASGEYRGTSAAANVKRVAVMGAYSSKVSVSSDEGVTFTHYSVPSPSGTSGNNEVAMSATDANNLVILRGNGKPYFVTNAFSGASSLTWTEGNIVLQKDGSNNDIMPKGSDLVYDSSDQLAADSVIGGKFYLLSRATNGMRLYVSTDGGANWTLTGSQVLPSDAGRRGGIYAVPDRQNELIYVTGDGGGLWRSINGGVDWTQLSSVSDARAASAGKNAPGNTNATLYVAGTVKLNPGDTTTVTGIFRSTDNGNSWTRINDDANRFPGVEVMTADRNVYGRVYMGNGTSPIIIDSAPQAGITNLAAAATGNKQVTLTWSDVSGETKYKIERREGASGNWIEIATDLAANSTSYVDTGASVGSLKAGTSYSYRLRWMNASSTSDWSNVVSATPTTAVITSPVFATSNTVYGVQLSGTSTLGVSGTGSSGNNSPSGELPANAINQAYNKYLNFGKTNTGLMINPTFNSGNGSIITQMRLWTANDAEERDPASYKIYGTNTALSSGGMDLSSFTLISEGSLALPSGRNTTGLSDANSQLVSFTNGTAYKNYLVLFPTVKNATTANSMQIGEVQLYGTAATAATVPVAPSSVAAAAQSSSSIRVTWSDLSNETGYDVQYKEGTSGTWTDTSSDPAAGSTSQDITGLKASTQYYVRVRGKNAAGEGAWSDGTANATTSAAAAGTLISSSKSATASSLESSSYPASNVTDGSTGTRWASQQGSDNEWIYIDLGSSYNVSRIRLYWETAAGKDYKLQVKADNPGTDTGWTDLKSVTGNTTANSWLDYTGLSGSGRYVRMRGTLRATGWGYSLYEFEVYGTAAVATSAKLSGTVMGTTGSWNNEGNTRDKAFDGDLNTFFDAPTGDGNWVGLDLGTAKTITSIKFAPRLSGGNSNIASRMDGGYFQVSNSADFSSATTIHTISGNPTEGSLTTVTVSVAGTWRYIRFVSPTGGYGNIAEFEAWGY